MCNDVYIVVVASRNRVGELGVMLEHSVLADQTRIHLVGKKDDSVFG